MHTDRLIKLAELLEADAANPHGIKFDLGQWGSVTSGDVDAMVDISCGTAACAMGLAVLSGAFSGVGLYNASISMREIIPAIRGESDDGGFCAAAALFGIEPWDAEHLFCADTYPDDAVITGAEGELMVSARIREFVGENK